MRGSPRRGCCLGPAVLKALTAHTWPGNVRELANVMEREVALLPPEQVTLDELRSPRKADSGAVLQPPSISPPSSGRWRGWSSSQPPPVPPKSIIPMAEVERQTYLSALELCGGRVTAAARALGVSKTQFYAKLNAWQRDGKASGVPGTFEDPEPGSR